MFEENEYIKLTNQLQNTVTTTYAIIMIIAIIIGIAGGGVALIIITAIVYNVYSKIKKSDLEVKNTYQEKKN